MLRCQKETDSVQDFVSNPTELGRAFFLSSLGRGGIVEAPMKCLGSAWEDRATLLPAPRKKERARPSKTA